MWNIKWTDSGTFEKGMFANLVVSKPPFFKCPSMSFVSAAFYKDLERGGRVAERNGIFVFRLF